ncbi:hypothetical protein Ahia01_000523500 [Argonauta hians]
MLDPKVLLDELTALRESFAWGIDAKLLSNNNVFEWIVQIEGLPTSIWKGGTFTLFIEFPPEEAEMRPKISFCTIPFHPNVAPETGHIQFDFNMIPREGNYMLNVLQYIQHLLSNPILQRAINVTAREMFVNMPLAYRNVVTDCVLNSQKIKGIDFPECLEELTPDIPRQKLHNSRNQISFEQYHSDWNNIATCKVKVKK